MSTRRNHGVRELEMRLPAFLVPGFCGPADMVIAGVCFHFVTHWIGPAIGSALVGLAVACANNVAVTYIVDSYLFVSGEVITVVFVIRYTISCSFALYGNTWAKNMGIAQSFGCKAGIEVFMLSTCIIFYYVGKRIQHFTSTYVPMKDLHLRRTRAAA